MLYRIFACSYSLLVTFETLLYMLRTGRPWTIGIFSDLFFSTGTFQQKAQICYLWLLKKSSSANSESKPGKFCCSRGEEQPVARQQRFLKASAAALPPWASPTPAKSLHMPASPWLWASQNETPNLPGLEWEAHPFFSHRGRKELCLSISLKERITWRDESSLHACVHTLIPCSALLRWVQAATNWGDCFYCSDLISF